MSEQYPPPQPEEPARGEPGAGGSTPGGGPHGGEQPFPSYQPYEPGPQYPPPTAPGQPYQPLGYGYSREHRGATTAMTLGITSLAVVLLGLVFLCGLISPVGALIGPFAIWHAVKAKREIDADPQGYTNKGHADTGLITGIIGTVLGALSILFFALVTLAFLASLGGA